MSNSYERLSKKSSPVLAAAWLVLTVLFLAVAAPPVLAQDVPSEGSKADTTQNEKQEDSTDSTEGEELIEEVVVSAMRQVIVDSLDEKKQSDAIIDVLSAGDAGRFPDNNVAEALGRLPGVTFMRDSDSGNGEFISIRGLDAGLNNIQFNGVNSATANPGNRRVSLDGISAAGVNKIVVKKTLLPSDEAVGIGGSVNIVTINPLDFSEDSKLTAEADLIDQSFADDYGSHFALSGFKKFSDTLAISGAVDIRNRKLRNYTIDPSTAGVGTSIVRLPELFNPDGTPFDYDAIADDSENPNDPAGTRLVQAADVAWLLENTHGLVPVESLNADRIRYHMDDSVFDTLTLNLTLGWRPTDKTEIQFGGRYSDRETDNSEQGIEFDSRAEFVDLDADGVFETRRIGSQKVESVYSLEDQTATNGTAYFKGFTDLDRVNLDYGLSYSRAKEANDTVRMNYVINDAPWPEGFAPYDFSKPIYPLPVFTQFVNNTVSDAGLAAMQLEDLDIRLDNSQENTRYAANFDATFDFDTRFLKTLTIGAKFEDSETDQQDWNADIDNDTDPTGMFLGTNGGSRFALGDTSLLTGQFENFSPVSRRLTGIQIPVLSANQLRAFRSTFLNSFDGYTDPEYAGREYDTLTEEQELAVYLQGEFKLADNVTLLAGARGSWYDGSYTSSRSQSQFLFISLFGISVPELIDQRNTTFVSESDNFELLPRAVLTWRPNDRIAVRLAGTTSIARPPFNKLSAKTDLILLQLPSMPYQMAHFGDTYEEFISTITLDDLMSNRIHLNTGNPNLKNSRSDAYDLSVEFYFNETTALSAALFHKRVSNIFSLNQGSVTSVEDMDRVLSLFNGMNFTAGGQALVDQLGGPEAIINAPNAQLSISVASNDADSEATGIELGFAHGFEWAPGFLSNFGVFGNVTWQDSEIVYPSHVYGSRDFLVKAGEVESGDVFTQKSQLFNAPDVSGNFGLYFDKGGVFANDDYLDMTLSMSYTDMLYIDDGGFGLPRYEQDYTQWDFTAVYHFDAEFDAQIYFKAVDFLDDGSDPTTLETTGESSLVPQRSTFNGRELQLGVRVNF